MNNVDIMNDADLAGVDGGTMKAWLIIGAVSVVCPILGAGMAVGYIINS